MAALSTKSLPFPTELWDSYRASRSIAARNAIVEYYLPLLQGFVDGFANRLPRDADVDDIASSAASALIHAVERFDPKHKTQFWSFASHRIRGAMLDSCRDSDRAPRLVREAHKKLSRARDVLIGSLGREPTRDELRDYLKISPERFALLIRNASQLVEFKSTASVIGANDGGKTQDLGELLIDHRHEGPGDAIERRDLIAHVFSFLPCKYAIFITHYWLDGLTMKQIGSRMGYSESRVSQLVGNAIQCARHYAEAA